jgi:hypothetical protein
MAVGVILEFEGVGRSEYEAVNDKLGIDPKSGKGDWPPGIRSHVGATTDGGLVVTEVWDSQEAQAAFMESRLGAALGEVGVPEPVRVTWTEVLLHHTA